ncbi:MAG: protein translocase subunit SecD [Planctomycetota bacterium]|nr:MAG: protein translocase subunit SecD [Planctomycetota bacterium]
MVPYLSRKIFGIAALVLLTIFSLVTSQVNLGLDLQGGSRIVYRLPIEQAKADGQIGENEDPVVVVRETADIFRRRLEISGSALQDLPIYPQGEDRVVLELPGMTEQEAERVKSTIINQGSLQFRIVVDHTDTALDLAGEIQKYKDWIGNNPEGNANTFNKVEEKDGGPRAGILWMELSQKALDEEQEGKGSYRVDSSLTAIPLRQENVIRGVALDDADSWVFRGADLGFVGAAQDRAGFNAVSFEFKSHRRGAFEVFTKEYKNRSMAIVLNEEVISAPVIQNVLPGGGIITGGRNGFSQEEMRELITVLRTGSLSIKPILESQLYTGPTLGGDAIRLGLWSAIIGSLAVFAFMLIYYRFNGIVACMALLFNGFILFGAMAFTQATLTLPGLAGLVLTIGMAVDANILIFERVREERRRGREVPQAYKNGYERAFTTIVDANLTSLITALILFQVGTGPVRGFAATLSLGILTSMFSALVFSKVLMHFLVFSKPAKISEVKMMSRLAGGAKIDFLAKRKVAAMVSAVLMVAGLATFALKGSGMMGIDFTGGGIAQIHLKEPASISDMRGLLAGYTVTRIKGDTDSEELSNRFLVKGKLSERQKAAMEGEVDTGDAAFFEQELRERLGDRLHLEEPFPELSTVGERVSGDMQQKAIQAILLSFIAVVIYMNFRFKEFRYGIAAVVAVFHDIIITLGFLAIFKSLGLIMVEINLEIIAAFLTIIGYSLNDTIVVFDRVRENLPRRKESFPEIINLSINQSLSRTILTSVTTFFVVAVLFVMNKPMHNVLEGFSFAMLVGVVVGTYSSMFVASPMLLFLDRWARKRRLPDGATAQKKKAKAATAPAS